MKKLRHSITIEGFSYTRHSTLDELSHEIVMNSLLVQYKELNEFNVNNFRLTYSLTKLMFGFSTMCVELTSDT